MLVHVSKLLGRMTGIQISTGLEKTEHSPLSNPLLSDRMQLTADEQEQEQISEYCLECENSFKTENAL